MDYDVVVIGLGPAGGTATINAVKEGARVVALEKRKNVGESIPCCGEAIVSKVLEDHSIPVSPKYVANKFDKISYELNGKEVSIPIAGYTLHKEKFEEHLIDCASMNGSEIRLGCKVKKFVPPDNIYLDSGDVIRGKVIVACDGYPSRIAKGAGFDTILPRKDIGICKQYTLEGIDVDRNTMKIIWWHKYSPNGYIWIIPKGSDVANIGVAITPTVGINVNNLLTAYIEEEFPQGKIIREVSGVGPLAKPIKNPVKGQVLLAGESAFHVMAETGGGIGTSMFAGRFAGQTAGKYSTGIIDSLNYYNELVKPLNADLVHNYDLKERIWFDKDFANKLFYYFKTVSLLNKLFPDFVKRKIRY